MQHNLSILLCEVIRTVTTAKIVRRIFNEKLKKETLFFLKFLEKKLKSKNKTKQTYKNTNPALEIIQWGLTLFILKSIFHSHRKETPQLFYFNEHKIAHKICADERNKPAKELLQQLIFIWKKMLLRSMQVIIF